jgi:hypothetical protein
VHIIVAFVCAEHKIHSGPAMVQALAAGRTQRRPGLHFGEFHVGFVVDRVALKQAFSECFAFPLHYHSTNVSSHILFIYRREL